jgi:hypothetical protein
VLVRILAAVLAASALGCQGPPAQNDWLKSLDDAFSYPSPSKRSKRLHYLLESLGRAQTPDQRAAANAVIARLAERYRAEPADWILEGLDETPFPAGHPHVLCGFFRAVPAETLTAHYGPAPPPASAFARCPPSQP